MTSVGILRNNLAYSNNGHGLLAEMTHGGPISDDYNSWDTNLGVKITDADFQSVAFAPPPSCPAMYVAGGTRCCAPSDPTCFGGMAGARNPDGSLPAGVFLRLAAGSSLVDKGTNVGLPYSGHAPDLGCFETGLAYDPSDGGVASVAGSSPTDGGMSEGAGDAGSTGAGSSGAGTSSGAQGGGSGSSGGQGRSATGHGSPAADASADQAATNGSAGCACRVTAGRREPGVATLLAIGAMLAARWRARPRRR